MTTPHTASATAVVACPFCQTLNRVVLGRIDDRPKCADCTKPLLLDRPVKATDASFDAMVQGASVPVVVDFYADWCGPCQRLAPVLEELAAETPGARIVKVNVDQSPSLATEYGVNSIPSLKVFKNGAVTDQLVGLVSKSQLQSLLTR